MKLEPIIASTFRSDGGTQFGPVPRALWSRQVPVDEANRVALHANSILFTLDDGRRGLVDLGCGSPERLSAAQRSHAGLDEDWPLMDELARRGIDRHEIEIVVLTHLHWDHVGGVYMQDGSLSFPNAEHYVDLHEMDAALSGNPLLGTAYAGVDLKPLTESGKLKRMLNDEKRGPSSTVVPGLTLARTGGHTLAHCQVIFEGESDGAGLELGFGGGAITRAIFAADVCPTHWHLPVMYTLGFDTHTLETRRWKSIWLPQFVREDTLLLFCHDPVFAGGTLKQGPKHIELDVGWRFEELEGA